MPEFATEPITFTAGQRFLEQKATLPTRLNSAAIANRLPARFRGQSFFSATVEKDSVLRRMKDVTQSIADGKVGYARGREMLKEFLPKLGYDVPLVDEPGEQRISKIASTARLDLILQQNVAMAHAVGQREVSEHPEVKALYPNYKYVAVLDASTRSSHAQLDGLVLPKDHPFWATHFPPWEFNCRCMVLDTDEPVNGAASGFSGGANERQRDDAAQTGRIMSGMESIQLTPNASGFVFRSSPKEVFAEPDPELIEDPDLRASFKQAWADRFKPAIEEEVVDDPFQPATDPVRGPDEEPQQAPVETRERTADPVVEAPRIPPPRRTPEETRAAIQKDYDDMKKLKVQDLRGMMERTIPGVDWKNSKRDDLIIEYVRRVHGDAALRDFMETMARRAMGRDE